VQDAGWREREALTLEWAHVDFGRGVATLPDTKTGRSVRELGTPALAVLDAMRAYQQAGTPFVFPGAKPGAHYTDTARVWDAVRHAAGLPDVRLHDLAARVRQRRRLRRAHAPSDRRSPRAHGREHHGALCPPGRVEPQASRRVHVHQCLCGARRPSGATRGGLCEYPVAGGSRSGVGWRSFAKVVRQLKQQLA
jgi:hypothetical protein